MSEQFTQKPRPTLSPRSKAWWQQDTTTLLRLGIIVVLLGVGLYYLAQQAPRPSAPAAVSCASRPPQISRGGSPAPTQVSTVQEAYNCILDTYPASPPLDDQSLLRSAMSGVVTYLVQHQADQSSAVLPALTGDRTADWQRFYQTYNTITAHLSDGQQAELAEATITAMVASLHDDHAAYVSASQFTAGGGSSGPDMSEGTGLHFPVDQLDHASPPLFITAIDPGSPAQQAGLHAGDVVTAINGVVPFVGQQPVPEVMSWLYTGAPLLLQVQRPGSSQVLTAHLTPGAYPAVPVVSSRILPGNIIYIHLTEFSRPVSDEIVQAVQEAGWDHLKGMVLDLRGNGGGDPNEQVRLISMFVHDRVLSYTINRQGQRNDQQTVDSIPLLHIPLVALIDRVCASACDGAAADIHDLHLGRLVGTRTAGEVSGPAGVFFLNDGSGLKLPVAFMHGPNGEVVDGIGVPPDVEVPVTPQALATGSDPVLERGLQEL